MADDLDMEQIQAAGSTDAPGVPADSVGTVLPDGKEDVREESVTETEAAPAAGKKVEGEEVSGDAVSGEEAVPGNVEAGGLEMAAEDSAAEKVVEEDTAAEGNDGQTGEHPAELPKNRRDAARRRHSDDDDIIDKRLGKKQEENKKEVVEEPVQLPHSRHPQRDIPIMDHRLLAGKLHVYDWMEKVPDVKVISDVVEVRFKNTRKGFYLNPEKLVLKVGDIVAVEAALGHDIGIVSLTGELVKEQMVLKHVDVERNPLKKIYRKAKPHDIEKWQQAIALEYDTMIRSRKIAADLNLNMKIGDVEYQGDKTKAIFYYIADERVNFRTLIKVLAETFRIRIEMKQIGARQEAGRIGGIGPCGRALCCSKFITNFVSVSTSAARYQDISLNPQKLAGQCGKLKCCLNYEVDAYIDAQRDFPHTSTPLNAGDGLLYHQKTDIFGRKMYYTSDKEGRGAMIEIPVDRVKEIIAMNKRGEIPAEVLTGVKEKNTEEKLTFSGGVGEESLSRFDDLNAKKRKKGNRKKGGNGDRSRSSSDENRNDGRAANAENKGRGGQRPGRNSSREGNKDSNKYAVRENNRESGKENNRRRNFRRNSDKSAAPKDSNNTNANSKN